MFKFYVCLMLTFISLFLSGIYNSIYKDVKVKIDTIEEYQEIESVNMTQFEENIDNVKLEYQHKIDSLSNVVKTLNNEITRMKKNSIMNY